MPIEITMPALSPTMEHGTLAKWLVKEGDAIAPGDVIAEIETDKATMEVEAVDEGVIGKILVAEGTEGVKVNTPIAVIVQEGEDASAIAAGSGEKPAGAETEKAAAPATRAEPAAAEPRKEAHEAPAAAPAAPATPVREGERVFASPLARRIARDAGLDLASIAGSGPKGRVVKADVERAIAAGPAIARAATEAATPAAVPATEQPAAASDEAVLQLFEEGSYDLVPHDNMRKTIARRLVEAKSTIPHFYLTVDCRIDALLALRSQLNKAAPVRDGEPLYKLSVNDMVIKALALALRDVPDANVSWTNSHMIRHHHSDIGVAVAIPGGLITPVVRKAEEKSLSVISNEMKDYAARARDRKLKPHEYQGGSSAVSNLGMMGIQSFSAVINPPHATILAVGAGEQRPIVVDGKVEIATLMTVTLSTDHRCVDGALGAELLGAFRNYIENPLGMLV